MRRRLRGPERARLRTLDRLSWPASIVIAVVDLVHQFVPRGAALAQPRW